MLSMSGCSTLHRMQQQRGRHRVGAAGVVTGPCRCACLRVGLALWGMRMMDWWGSSSNSSLEMQEGKRGAGRDMVRHV
jgi:hypothetical protein